MPRTENHTHIYDFCQMPEVVTIGEVAAYLRLSKPTVAKYAEAGLIPGRKVGGQWRFFRDELRVFMEERRHVEQ